MTLSNGLTCTDGVSMCDFKGLEKMCLRGNKGRVRYCFFHSANGLKLVHEGARTRCSGRTAAISTSLTRRREKLEAV